MLNRLVKRGFGAGRVKEFFVVQRDGDTLGGIVAGPFENAEQCQQVIEALRAMYDRTLTWISGHLAD